MILADPAPGGTTARIREACWLRSAKAASARCFSLEASRLARNGRDWPYTVGVLRLGRHT